MPTSHPVARLSPFGDDDATVNVIIETSKGSRNKITFDPERELYELGGVLPVGASFPYDFGFVPSTLGDDGDPLDVLLLMDEPVFAGCLVSARLVGVITAEQQERDGAVERNDRLLAVAEKSRVHADVHGLKDLGDALLEEIEHFFVSYNEIKGKRFKPVGRKGAKTARTIVEAGAARFVKRRAKASRKRSGSTKRSGRR
jgi:inorganic pyrophosphatase